MRSSSQCACHVVPAAGCCELSVAGSEAQVAGAAASVAESKALVADVLAMEVMPQRSAMTAGA